MSDEDARHLAAALYEMRLLLCNRVGRTDSEPETEAAALAYALHNQALAVLQGKSLPYDEFRRRVESVDRRLGTDLVRRLRFHLGEGAALGDREPYRINVIESPARGDAYALWDWVRAHPWAALEEETLTGLKAFWSAYMTALYHNGIALVGGTPDFAHFDRWMAARHGDPLMSVHWAHWLGQTHGNEDGYAAFFEALDEFRTRELVELFESPVDHVLTPGRKTSLFPGGASIEQPIYPVIRVRLLSYEPEGVVFAELTRTRGEAELEWLGPKARARRQIRDRLGVVWDAAS